MTFPSVPALIPAEIAGLSQLQSLQVTGDGNSPAGAIPDSFRNLTSLTTLHLESTAITTIPNDLFSLLTKVTDLTLIANEKFAGDLTSITNLPLQRLVINKQRLGNPIDSLAGSQSLQKSLLSLYVSRAQKFRGDVLLMFLLLTVTSPLTHSPAQSLRPSHPSPLSPSSTWTTTVWSRLYQLPSLVPCSP